MEIIWLVLAVVFALMTAGCAIASAADIASGRMRFPLEAGFWGAMIFHAATALLSLWFLGLWLGY
jgi:hypothetical protein